MWLLPVVAIVAAIGNCGCDAVACSDEITVRFGEPLRGQVGAQPYALRVALDGGPVIEVSCPGRFQLSANVFGGCDADGFQIYGAPPEWDGLDDDLVGTVTLGLADGSTVRGTFAAEAEDGSGYRDDCELCRAWRTTAAAFP